MFNKDIFSEVLKKAIGNRTIKSYSEQSGVDRTYISKYINKKLDNPPSPEILKKLSLAAHNNITYEDLMAISDYSTNSYDNLDEDSEYVYLDILSNYYSMYPKPVIAYIKDTYKLDIGGYNIPVTNLQRWFKSLPAHEKKYIAELIIKTQSNREKIKVKVFKEISIDNSLEQPASFETEEYIQSIVQKKNPELNYYFFRAPDDSMIDCKISKGCLVFFSEQSDVENGDLGIVLIENNPAIIRRIYKKKNTIILQPSNANYAPELFTQDDIMNGTLKIIGKALTVTINL